jgi:hypothetical protein
MQTRALPRPVQEIRSERLADVVALCALLRRRADLPGLRREAAPLEKPRACRLGHSGDSAVARAALKHLRQLGDLCGFATGPCG